MFKDFLTEPSYHQSLHLDLGFFIAFWSLLELWTPSLHEPDKCSASQARIMLNSTLCQEELAVLQTYCSCCHTTRQSIYLSQTACLSLSTESQLLTSPLSAMPQHPWFTPSCSRNHTSTGTATTFMSQTESTGIIEKLTSPAYLWNSLNPSTAVHSCRVPHPGGMSHALSTAPGTQEGVSHSSHRPSL